VVRMRFDSSFPTLAWEGSQIETPRPKYRNVAARPSPRPQRGQSCSGRHRAVVGKAGRRTVPDRAGSAASGRWREQEKAW
jgi:hypothetical protein